MPCKTSDFRTQKFSALCAPHTLSLPLYPPLSFSLSVTYLKNCTVVRACVRVCASRPRCPPRCRRCCRVWWGVGWTSLCLTCATSRWYLGGVSRPGHINNNNTYTGMTNEKFKSAEKYNSVLIWRKKNLLFLNIGFLFWETLHVGNFSLFENSYGCKNVTLYGLCLTKGTSVHFWV